MKIQPCHLPILVALSALAACNADRYRTTVKSQELADLAKEPKAAHAMQVSGIDIWTTGAPSRKYRVLGVIHDIRRNYAWRMKTYYQDIAKVAIKAGGDAAVILLADSKITTRSENCVSGMLPRSECDEASGASYSPEAPNKELTVYSENRESNEAPLEYRDSHILVIQYLN